MRKRMMMLTCWVLALVLALGVTPVMAETGSNGMADYGVTPMATNCGSYDPYVFVGSFCAWSLLCSPPDNILGTKYYKYERKRWCTYDDGTARWEYDYREERVDGFCNCRL